MGAIETRKFQTADGVAVRLPEALGIAPGTVVTVEQVGDQVLIRPVAERPDGLTGASLHRGNLEECASQRNAAQARADRVSRPARPVLTTSATCRDLLLEV